MKSSGVLTVCTACFLMIFSANVALAKPPGLSKSGHYPHGLQGKTPAGWSKGQKKGWYKTHPMHRHTPDTHHIWKVNNIFNP